MIHEATKISKTIPVIHIVPRTDINLPFTSKKKLFSRNSMLNYPDLKFEVYWIDNLRRWKKKVVDIWAVPVNGAP